MCAQAGRLAVQTAYQTPPDSNNRQIVARSNLALRVSFSSLMTRHSHGPEASGDPLRVPILQNDSGVIPHPPGSERPERGHDFGTKLCPQRLAFAHNGLEATWGCQIVLRDDADGCSKISASQIILPCSSFRNSPACKQTAHRSDQADLRYIRTRIVVVGRSVSQFAQVGQPFEADIPQKSRKTSAGKGRPTQAEALPVGKHHRNWMPRLSYTNPHRTLIHFGDCRTAGCFTVLKQ